MEEERMRRRGELLFFSRGIGRSIARPAVMKVLLKAFLSSKVYRQAGNVV
jgi:hypothetical protein